MAFTVRTNKPEAGNKNFIRKASGGWNTCIKGKPTDADCDVLSNCVGYASGRFNEIYNEVMGTTGCKYTTLNCNAENFIERAKSAGLEVVDYPTLGGIMVMQKGSTLSGSDGAGHVFIPEKILEYGSNGYASKIYTSESNYGREAFFNATRTNSNGRWGLSSNYSFRGCIVNPAVGTEGTYKEPETTEPEIPTTYKFNIGDKVVISGSLYTSSNAKNPAGSVTNKITNITRIAEGAKHPYNTTGDLGWMDEADITKYEEEAATSPQKFNIGDKVVISGKLYTSSNATKAAGSVTNKVTNITRYAKGAKHPYNTTGDLGWMDESSITAYTGATTYTVQEGDTLSEIAAQYNMSWKELYALNKFVIGNNPDVIKPGQVLTIKN